MSAKETGNHMGLRREFKWWLAAHLLGAALQLVRYEASRETLRRFIALLDHLRADPRFETVPMQSARCVLCGGDVAARPLMSVTGQALEASGSSGPSGGGRVCHPCYRSIAGSLGRDADADMFGREE